jgi:hypothetical protein
MTPAYSGRAVISESRIGAGTSYPGGVPLVLYTLWRILLFVAALGLGYAAGLRSWLLVLVAAVVAFAVSYLALRGPRDSASRWLAERAERRKDAPGGARDADAAFEDAAVDGELGDPRDEHRGDDARKDDRAGG